MTLRRLAATLLLVGTALAVTAPQALAHTELTSSDPAEGASVVTAPQQIKLTFGEAVTLPANPIQVSGPGGAQWTVANAAIDGAVITAPMQPSGPPGQYTINYKVTAADGDAVKGAVHFMLAAVLDVVGAHWLPHPTNPPFPIGCPLWSRLARRRQQ